MTIMITGNDHDRDQMIKQLRKLHDVHFVKEMVAEKIGLQRAGAVKGGNRPLFCVRRAKKDGYCRGKRGIADSV